MNAQIVNANVVIVARQFNPSIITQLWLVKNEILSDDDFEEGGVFTPVFSQFSSREFDFLVIPEQLQFTPKKLDNREGKLIKLKVGKIIKSLPHTPFIGIGINFIWHIIPDYEDIQSISRSIFYRDIPLFRNFDSPDARFGGYLSKNVLGSRLKLDIKPITITSKELSEERLQFSFNFHLDLLSDDKLKNILTHIGNWHKAKLLTVEIIKSVTNGAKK